jgi:hypothetical protein
MVGPTQKSSGQSDNGPEKFEDAADRDAQKAERKQKEPDERIEHQRQQGDWPAKHQKNAPEQEFDHTPISPVAAIVCYAGILRSFRESVPSPGASQRQAATR